MIFVYKQFEEVYQISREVSTDLVTLIASKYVCYFDVINAFMLLMLSSSFKLHRLWRSLHGAWHASLELKPFFKLPLPTIFQGIFFDYILSLEGIFV